MKGRARSVVPKGGASRKVRGAPPEPKPPGGGPRVGGPPSNCDLGPLGASEAFRGGGPGCRPSKMLAFEGRRSAKRGGERDLSPGPL